MGKKLRTRSKCRKLTAAQVNAATLQDYFYRLRKICLSMFEWRNLPDSMDARFLEMTLFNWGQAAMLYSDNYGFINTKAANAGKINIYGLPTQINCFSYGGFSEQRTVYNGLIKDAKGNYINKKNEEAVLVLNNFDSLPTVDTIELFAWRLANAERTSDINIATQKMPFIISTDERQRLSMKVMYEQIEENEVAIVGDKNALATDSIKVLKTGAPFIADKLKDYKRDIWNEALLFLGIQVIEEKKERLVEVEASQNNEVTNLNLQSFMITRQKACDEFNEKFGTDIEVKVRSDLKNVVKNELSSVKDFESEDLEVLVGGQENE